MFSVGIGGVFGIAALLLLIPAFAVRPKNPHLSNMLFAGAGVVIALPFLGVLALFLHRNDPP